MGKQWQALVISVTLISTITRPNIKTGRRGIFRVAFNVD
jgi:hypothetical protein